jgi:hypothetical protein
VRYWWVNQNKTHEQEQAGGYLWSPKTNRNGAYNQFYENMKQVTPGDLVFCAVGCLDNIPLRAQSPPHQAGGRFIWARSSIATKLTPPAIASM